MFAMSCRVRYGFAQAAGVMADIADRVSAY